jgi:ribosome-binding factor A
MNKNKKNNLYTNDRLAQQINKQLAIILQKEVRDPRVGILTITDITITKDLSLVKVYFTNLDINLDKNPLGSPDSPDSVAKLLNNMAGFLRTELASKISVRHMPELRFYQDDSIVRGNRIEELLDKIKKEE